MIKRKTKLAFILFISCFLQGYCQDNSQKWTSSVYIDLISNNNVNYTYYDPDKIQEFPLNEKGALELLYNIDYRVFNKLSITAIAGLTHFNNPSFSSIKTGLGLKLIYVDNKYHYLTLQYGYHIPFSRDNFKEGHQIKIGQYFDIAEVFRKRLLLGIFYNYDYFYLDGAKPIRVSTNKPSSLLYNSFGISLGVKF